MHARARGGAKVEHRLRRTGVEGRVQLRPVQLDRADRVVVRGFLRLDGNFEKGLALGPIGHGRAAAAHRLEQADHAAGQVIFDIGQAQDILADQPALADIAARHRELDIGYVESG